MTATAFRCRGCGRVLTAYQATIEHARDPYAQRPTICRGVLEQVVPGVVPPAVAARGVVVVDFGAADDRAGVELAIGVQPVGGDQGEAVGGGEVRGHENSITTKGSGVTENRRADGSQRFAEVG